MPRNLPQSDQDVTGVHGGLEVEHAAATLGNRRRLKVAGVFTFAEPMGPAVQIGHERRMREIDEFPRSVGNIEPTKMPTEIKRLFYS